MTKKLATLSSKDNISIITLDDGKANVFSPKMIHDVNECLDKVPTETGALIITGSSGLYESAMGSGYTKRSDYEVMKAKAQEVFYDPEVATKTIVDEVYETVNDRSKLVKILAIAKSAIRHNMAKDLPEITVPTCIVWGKNDIVTPPNVGEEFKKLLPDSELFWIDKCGHAAMMEHPDQFNKIVFEWLTKRGL